jgi:hypothetical protein
MASNEVQTIPANELIQDDSQQQLVMLYQSQEISSQTTHDQALVVDAGTTGLALVFVLSLVSLVVISRRSLS